MFLKGAQKTNMKLMFLTLAPLSSNLGHLARLSGELKELAKLHKIIILCLGKEIG